jgi:hypothetical protein
VYQNKTPNNRLGLKGLQGGSLTKNCFITSIPSFSTFYQFYKWGSQRFFCTKFSIPS